MNATAMKLNATALLLLACTLAASCQVRQILTGGGSGGGGGCPDSVTISGDDTLRIYCGGSVYSAFITAPNFSNANLTLTGNRTHAGAGFDLTMGGFDDVTVTAATGQASLTSTTGAVTVTGAGAGTFYGQASTTLGNTAGPVQTNGTTYTLNATARNYAFNAANRPTASQGLPSLCVDTATGRWYLCDPVGCDSLYGATVGNFSAIILYDTCTGSRDTVLLASDQVIGMQAESAADTVLAVYYNYVPVDVTSNATILTPPASPQPGDWFGVVDSRANAAANNITVDFTAVTQRYYGVQADDVLATDGASVKYIYVDGNAGWVRESR